MLLGGIHLGDIAWALWYLISLSFLLSGQIFIQAYSKENTKSQLDLCAWNPLVSSLVSFKV